MLPGFQQEVPTIPHKETDRSRNSSYGTDSKMVALMTLRINTFIVFKFLYYLKLFNPVLLLCVMTQMFLDNFSYPKGNTYIGKEHTLPLIWFKQMDKNRHDAQLWALTS